MVAAELRRVLIQPCAALQKLRSVEVGTLERLGKARQRLAIPMRLDLLGRLVAWAYKSWKESCSTLGKLEGQKNGRAIDAVMHTPRYHNSRP